MLERASLVHLLNQATLDCFRRTYPELAARKHTLIVPNGVAPRASGARDLTFEAELGRKLVPGKYTVICLSRWAHGKGLEHFVRAAELLVESGHDMQFVLAGRKYLSWEKDWYAYVLGIQ